MAGKLFIQYQSTEQFNDLSVDMNHSIQYTALYNQSNIVICILEMDPLANSFDGRSPQYEVRQTNHSRRNWFWKY